MKKIKNLILTFLILICGTLAFSQTLTDSEILIQLKNDAHINTLKCPTIINSEYRLDCIMAYAPKTVEYEYTVAYYVKDIDVYKAKSILEPSVIDNVKKTDNEGLIEWKKNKVTFKYSYYDMDGVYLFTIIVSPDKYTIMYWYFLYHHFH